MTAPIKSKIQNAKVEESNTERFKLAITIIGAVVLGACILWLLVKLVPVLLVLVATFFLIGTLNTPVERLEKRGMGRQGAIAVVFFLLFVVLAVAITVTIPTLVTQVSSLIEQGPELRDQLADKIIDVPLGAPLVHWLRHGKVDVPSDVGVTAFTYSLRVIEIIAYCVSVFFLAFYMMMDRDRLRGGMFAMVPRAYHIRLSRVLLKLETIVGAYLRGQFITSLCFAVFTFVLLVSCGVDNAMTLATIAGVADVLPYIGVFLSVGPAVIAALPYGQIVTAVVLVFMLAYEEFESRILVPKVYGRELRLPSSIVFFSLLVGGTLMGIIGALLALPVAATVLMLIEELRVQLPGKQEQVADEIIREEDHLAEQEYERRTEGVPTVESAAIAVEIAEERIKDQKKIEPKNEGEHHG